MRVMEKGVLGADARIVEARRDRVGVEHLPIRVREERRARAVQHARAARAERRRARRLHAQQAHLGIVEKPGERPDRVRAAADASDDDLRQPALRVQKLCPRLPPDHGLELAHDLRIRGGPDAGAD